jgi:hypothetical protein
MTKPVFMVHHIRWWQKPVPLYAQRDGGFVHVGWAWNQWAYLVNNTAMGWVAFVEDQTPENIDVWKCPHCGASLWGTQRDKIETAIRAEQRKK